MKFFPAINFRSLSAACICILLGASAWILSGSTKPSLLFMLAVSCAAFSFSVLAIAFPKAAGEGGVRNPFRFYGFWFGVAFLFLVFLQILNPSARFIQADNYSFLEPISHISFLPTCVENSFDRGGPEWFFAQALMLILFSFAAYSVFLKRACVLYALVVFALSASAMAAFAIIQKKLGAPAIYWNYEAEGTFFGTFFLANVSASFFNAALASCLSLLASCSYFKLKNHALRVLYYSVFSICALLNAAAVVVSTSKGGMAAMLVVLAGAFLIVVFKFFYARFSFVASVGFVAATSIAALLFAALVLFSPSAKISDDEAKFIKRDTYGSALSRIAINKVGFEVFCEHPIWGVGAEGYSYYTVPKMIAKQNTISKKPVAAFRAHCDFLGFLVEFGIVGTALILGALCSVLLKAWKLRARLSNANLIAAAGAFGVIFHALVDMPLRISSTMLAFVFLLVVFISPLSRNRDSDLYK